MKRYILLSSLLLGFTGSIIFAQKNLTIEDCVTGAVTYLAPEDIEQLSWRPETRFFTYIEDNNLVQVDARSSNKIKLIDFVLIRQFTILDSLNFPSYFPEYLWVNSEEIIFRNENNFIFYNIVSNDYKSAKIIKEAQNFTVSPAAGHIAYTLDNNLYIYELATGSQRGVNVNQDSNIVSGQTVSRNEFGISSGIFWSPDSKKLAFYVKDEHSVTDYPLVDITARVAEPAMIKYPMAGMESEVVSIGIYNTITNELIFLDAGNPDDHYLTNLTWTPDGSELYIAEINRGQDTVKMNRYNAGTGKIISNIFTETDEKYVNPLEPAYFIPGRNNDFIWLSRKDGYNHFYLHTSDGLEKQLTKGNWEVLDFKGFDKKGTEIFFTATKDGYVNEMFYKVDISSGKISLLTPEEGVHEILLNGGEGLFLDRFSSAAIPNRIILRDKDGRINTSILEADDPLKDYTIARIETATITAADGSTELTYRMFTPSEGIVPGVKYPAIVYVYNGPMNQLIRNEWINRTELWLSYMAEQGYIGFILDGRGSANRGKEFEQVTFRQLGKIEMQDQLKGVEFLKSLGYVDAERIGIFGWSYGGFMTTSLMTSYPGIFKAGVAGGPVTDWKFYEVMYGERYMDTPAENPEGYLNTSVLEKAGNLEGRLLIIHGGMDPVVVWQHSLALLKEFIDEGVMVDYFVYPTHEHNVTGTDRVHLMKKVTDYFLQNL